MIIYKVLTLESSHWGYCTEEEDVNYYVCKTLAEDDLKKRLEEWENSPSRIEEIRTED